MFTNAEIREYSNLLYNLNEGKPQLPNGYTMILEGGGKDGIQCFKFLSNQSKQMYVIWIQGTNFLRFNDIGINIKTIPVKFYDGVAHRGYLESAIKTINIIQNYLKDQSHSKILCLGHSLGGAVSSIICTILNKGNWGNFQDIDEIREKYKAGSILCLAFASPPCFSETIINESKNFITSIVSKNDIVPKLGDKFNSLAIFHKLTVVFLLIEFNALGNKKMFDKYQMILDQILNTSRADRIPGKVVIIDMEEKTLGFGGNHREIQKFSDFGGVKEHFFVNYYESIKCCVKSDDKVFLGEKIQKEIKFQKESEKIKDDNFTELYEKIGDSFSQFVKRNFRK